MTETTPIDDEKVLTVAELCERWHCARKTVTDAIRADKLKAFRVGKRIYRIALAEVERFERTREAA